MELALNLKPALSPEKLDARVQRDFSKYIRKQLKNSLHDLLPGKLIDPVMDAAYLDPDRPVHEITQEERGRLVHALRHLMLTVTRTRPLASHAIFPSDFLPPSPRLSKRRQSRVTRTPPSVLM